MGLAASQARLLLLTAKNNALELQAQFISNERLLLAQEQETIAQEHADATSNSIYTCSVVSADGKSTSQETMTLDSLAKSQGSGAAGADGKTIVIADANGKPMVAATAKIENGKWVMSYQVPKADGSGWETATGTNSAVRSLNVNSMNSVMQNGLQNGALQLWVAAPEETSNGNSTSLEANLNGMILNKENYFVRKSPESLSNVTSRYYTEDDAAAQADYQVAMARVNALDTKLENKLNQIETQKKAVEQEMESVDSIIKSNIERTFKYFG